MGLFFRLVSCLVVLWEASWQARFIADSSCADLVDVDEASSELAFSALSRYNLYSSMIEFFHIENCFGLGN